MALRWTGALHHLALRGRAPWASCWPPHVADDTALDAAIRAAWRDERAHVEAALAKAPQTNEVQRSAALRAGLGFVAHATGRPLALLEIGASAGLNLWPERRRIDYGGWTAGPADAGLSLRCDWQGAVPAYAVAEPEVVARAGCDLHPVDLRVPDEALRLKSFVWPDQAERVARLARAIEVTAPWFDAEQVTVVTQPAAAFVEARLAARPAGVATVLMHSIVWQYLPAAEQRAIEAALQREGARAGADSPIAWLRLEPPAPDRQPELRCTLWPGGADTRLGRAHAHVGSITAAEAPA